MRRSLGWGCAGYGQRGLGSLLLALVLLVPVGCNLPPPGGGGDAEAAQAPPDDDTAFIVERADDQNRVNPKPPHVTYELAVVHILVPWDKRSESEKVWDYLREDVLDAQTQLRVRKNGIRVGIGNVRWWSSIKSTLEGIEGHRVTVATPLRVPVGFALSLELDTEPREQTLFYVERDGYLSGSTLPASRNVLRINYFPDPSDIESVRLQAVPETHREQEGWEWVRRESGLWQVPRQSKQSYDAAGFMVTLRPGEFALIAPSENADVYGLLGGAFLTRVSEGRHYESYVFLRPEAKQIGPHD